MLRLLPLLESQVRSLGKRRPTLIFPEGNDPRIISAASRLSGVANVVVITRPEDARRLVESGKAEISGSLRRFLASVRFVMPDDEPSLCQEFFETFWAMSEGKRWAVSYERAQQLVREPIMFACMAVRCGYADSVLGGVVAASRDFFRPALRLLHTNRTAFEVGFFSLPDEHPSEIYQQNLVAFADVAVNPDPPPQALAEIAVGACKIVRDLVPPDVLPHVNGAILSYSTRGSGEGESVNRIREAAQIIPDLLAKAVAENPLYASIRIEPELQISCAISIAAARSKLHDALADPNSPLGRANVLIVPSLDSGNLLYHLYATRYPNADRVLMLGGMNARVLDFSRSSTACDVTLSGMATVLRLKRMASWQCTPRDHFFRRFRSLVINPGSTTTKVAAYEGDESLFEVEVAHAPDELATCGTVYGQLELRRRVIEKAVTDHGLPLESLAAVVGRGGLVRPVLSGTYEVSDTMLADLADARFGEHASNLGPAIARAIAAPLEIPAYTVDPVVVDELDPVARLTGIAGYDRRAVWHALSQKAVARRYAEERYADYEDLNLVVAHMGGGITVGCHRKGRGIDVTNGLDEGPMTAERAGSVPHSVILDLVFRKGMDERQVRRQLVGQGGLVSHLGTSDLRKVEEQVDAGDEHAALVFEALARGIAAEIAGGIVRFEGEPVDQILLTGGMARSDRLVDRIRALLAAIPFGITVFPGEIEAEALRDAALRILRGQEPLRTY